MARRIYPLTNGNATFNDGFGTRQVPAIKNARGEVLAFVPEGVNATAFVKRLNAYQCTLRKKAGKRSECCV